MTHSTPSKIKLRLPPQGLMMQLVTIILLPLTIILLAITFGSLTIHQNAMRSMVGERDERVVTTTARALSAQVDLRVKQLEGMASMLAVENPTQIGLAEDRSGPLLADFDQGLAIFSSSGALVSSIGERHLWDGFITAPSHWQKVFSRLTAEPGTLVTAPSPVDESQVGIIATPTLDGIIVGAFSITSLVNPILEQLLSSSDQLEALLVDSSGQVLYTAGDTGDASASHPGIAEALQGRSGTQYIKVDGDEHVTAYSPVVSAGWALITEESWGEVSTPTLRTTQVAPLVLVPALLVMLLALWLGTRQVVVPLRTLEKRASRLAWGDFSSIQEPVGGVAEIQHLQQELVEMAHQVQEAQRSLHGYIGSITAAQEDERHRLARELHDDTMQALIALKQRVQLAQLELEPVIHNSQAESPKLGEIAALTEQTIENLRRLTRALRPVYLEDLGLVPALEMLAGESGQAMEVDVAFHRQGTERRLEPTIELALYRIAQEALNNIARHAHATLVSLSIKFSTESVMLKVADNGKGFVLPKNMAEVAAHGHYGLLGLHERAELIGANLEIDTSPGKGTQLVVTLPV